jgi:hypothetical protein
MLLRLQRMELVDWLARYLVRVLTCEKLARVEAQNLGTTVLIDVSTVSYERTTIS